MGFDEIFQNILKDDIFRNMKFSSHNHTVVEVESMEGRQQNWCNSA
jgi:hypothetical protein